jgi:hypothetical protein
MRARQWAARCALPVALVALLTAGCTTAVTGTARQVPGAEPVVPKPVVRTRLDCTGSKVVRPAGAPYCYLLPAGFSDATGQLTLNYQSATPSQYDSAAAVAVHDVIIVAVYPLRQNSDTLSPAMLGQQVEAVLEQGAPAGFSMAGRPQDTTVDNARTVQVPVRQNDGQYSSTIYFVFRGFTEVEINCQYAQHRATVEQGCTDVRTSMQVIDPPR